MANKYPYVASAGPLVKTVNHLRKSFPKEVTADTLKKLGVAPNNESYVINVLRFLGVIDSEGKKVDARAKAFVQHEETAFASEFGKLVEDAYGEIFELHKDDAWKLDRSALTQFFRTTDHSSDVVGSRQASTFSALAALSGHADVPTPRSRTNNGKGAAKGSRPAKNKPSTSVEVEAPEKPGGDRGPGAVGLTVRVEVNLPANGDQETYDRIFRSIRENLIDGRS